MKPFLIVAAAFFALVFAVPAHAALMVRVSDTISDSRLSWPANHKIVFGVPSGVPASGQIIVSFPDEAFSISPSFSYSDVDLAVSTGSPYSGFVERSLAASPDAVNDGVNVASTTGPIVITLSSGSAIPAGAYVRLVFGTGNNQITNPSSTASYKILLNSYDNVDATLDYGTAMVAVLPAVGVDVNQDRTVPANILNGMPSGTIPSNISGVLVSFDTDVYATCRYATSTGVLYDNMANPTTQTSLGTFHTFSMSGISQGTTYNYYVRCQDFAGNKNATDTIISFTAGPPTGTGSGGGSNGGPAAPPGTPSGGGGGGGSPYPPLPSTPSLIIKGIALPGVVISVLEDGKTLTQSATTADSEGNFSVSIPSIPQGAYSFTLIENDQSGSAIASYTVTITVIAGTTNSITNILLPPDISFATSTIALGANMLISGFAPPSSTVQLWVTSQSGAQGPIKVTTSAGTNGAWSYSLATKGFSVDTYQIKAQASLAQYTTSNFSSISYLGVGTAVTPKGKGDLNGDGKVNLVDFSILLFYWGKAYAPADLNGNGVVDLPDFSILLFNWTG